MLWKVNIAAAAALLVVSIAPVGTYAQSSGGPSLIPGHQLHTQSKHLKARVPSDAFGAVADPAARPGGRSFETDPDTHIRFEMNRDDRDRRAGG